MSENSIRLEEKVSSQSMVDELMRKFSKREKQNETEEKPNKRIDENSKNMV